MEIYSALDRADGLDELGSLGKFGQDRRARRMETLWLPASSIPRGDCLLQESCTHDVCGLRVVLYCSSLLKTSTIVQICPE